MFKQSGRHPRIHVPDTPSPPHDARRRAGFVRNARRAGSDSEKLMDSCQQSIDDRGEKSFVMTIRLFHLRPVSAHAADVRPR